MTATLEGVEWSAERPGRTLPPRKTRYPLYRRLGGSQGRSGRVENLAPAGIRSPDSSAPSSVGIATDYGLEGPGSNPSGARFSARPDRPWGPPTLQYNGYLVFPGSKVRPGRDADHSPASSAAVIEE